MAETNNSSLEFHIGRGWLSSETSLVKRRGNQNDANGYYKTLGLSPDATREEIKAAYRKLAFKLHPDRGGDEELFRFVAEIAKVLLDDELKATYDAVGMRSVYLGNMEREELARSGVRLDDEERTRWPRSECSSEDLHWACFTTSGFLPDKDTDEWAGFCREVSPAVGYRGKIRVGVVEGGQDWPCDPTRPWGILSANKWTFVVFQRGVEPNRLHALCAMIDWQIYLLNQIEQGWSSAQDRESTKWSHQLGQEDLLESSRETKKSNQAVSALDFGSTPLSSAGMAASHQQRTP